MFDNLISPGKVGMKWSDLYKKLNKDFDWNKALSDAVGHEETMESVGILLSWFYSAFLKYLQYNLARPAWIYSINHCSEKCFHLENRNVLASMHNHHL